MVRRLWSAVAGRAGAIEALGPLHRGPVVTL